MNAVPMVAECFRHQHPDAYGGPTPRSPDWAELEPVVSRCPDGGAGSTEAMLPADRGRADARALEGIPASEGP